MDFLLLPSSISFPDYHTRMAFCRGGLLDSTDPGIMPDSVEFNAKQATSSGSGCVQVLNQKHHPVQDMSGAHPPQTVSPSSLTIPITIAGGVSLSEAHLGSSIRQLSKLKRFFTTLQQFGSDISPDVGERVHSLILSCLNSSVSIEEFHQKIQDITNYPLRSFVIPFLKSHLPMLQTEILHFARLSKQTPQQYLRQYEQAVLDSAAHPSGEPFEIFQPDIKENRKRRTPSDSEIKRPKENGFSDTSSEGPSPVKRHHPFPNTSVGSRLSPVITANHVSANMNLRLEDSTSVFRARERERYERYERTFQREISDERDMEDEWRNIHTMLNCILGMVEKTKRALAILQQRSHVEWSDCAHWGRRHLDAAEFDFTKQNNDIMTQYKSAEERVSEVRRRAEAVNEVKQQAVAELKKAVSVAETKASELVAVERAKMEKLISEARRQGTEEAMASISKQEDSRDSCWNCGRKANETCSGCNTARYCGTFCQHRDWENHHRICGKGTCGSQATSSTTVSPDPSKVPQTSTNTSLSPVSSTNLAKGSPGSKTMSRTEKPNISWPQKFEKD
ncbi:protein CBFA2T3-like isoform X2 [Tachypleus tridentatus]|uniref:protein CBFA2T3-like isoform X2 n=1 Tax=Tachypleus tridentatus TaxID=6853 RepID=UPI003FD108DC